MIAAADQPAGLPFYDADRHSGSAVADCARWRRFATHWRRGWTRRRHPPLVRIPLRHGAFLLMPSDSGRHAGVKVLTSRRTTPPVAVRGFRASTCCSTPQTATPNALLDGPELTAIRTLAVSMAAVQGSLAGGRESLCG